MSGFTADAADPLGALQPFVPCFLASAAGNLSVFFPDVEGLPAELSSLLELCFLPTFLCVALARPLFPRLELEATRAVSQDLDLTFPETSNLARSSHMSLSMVSGSFSCPIIYRKTSYSSSKTWGNRRQAISSEISVLLARKSRVSSAISESV